MSTIITPDHQLSNEIPSEENRVLGNDCEVKFVSVGNRTTEAKVDTGATFSSVHATDIRVNNDAHTVSFVSDAISDNIITMDLEGSQSVSSADGGDNTRPTVRMDIEINGLLVRGVLFNLNDRSNMDTRVLIGQNALKAGQFTVDVNKTDDNIVSRTTEDVMKAVACIVEHNVSFDELQLLMHTFTVNKL